METIGNAVRGMLPGRLRSPKLVAGRATIGSRLLVLLGWVIVLVVQAAILLALTELIELAHGLVSLYLDLAKMHLDLSSQYVLVTTPK